MTDGIQALIAELRQERDVAIDRAVDMQAAIRELCTTCCIEYEHGFSCPDDCPFLRWKGEW